MNKYRYFACPLYDESLPVIVTDIDTLESVNSVLKANYILDEYEIRNVPSSNIIQIHNKYKRLKITWLNKVNKELEEDTFILGINTVIKPFLALLDSYIGVPFNFTELRDCIINNYQDEYIRLFFSQIVSVKLLEDHIDCNFNKSNHLLVSTRVTTIKNRVTTIYTHYEA